MPTAITDYSSAYSGFCTNSAGSSAAGSYDTYTNAFCQGASACIKCKIGYVKTGSSGSEYCVLACKTSGSCDAATNICDGYWCSEGNVCADLEEWGSDFNECSGFRICSPVCSDSFSDCTYLNPSTGCGTGDACCYYFAGKDSSKCRAIEIIPPS